MKVTILGVDCGKVELVVNPQYASCCIVKNTLKFIISGAQDLSYDCITDKV